MIHKDLDKYEDFAKIKEIYDYEFTITKLKKLLDMEKL